MTWIEVTDESEAKGELLSLTPALVRQADVAALRAAGFEDRDVLAIAEVAAYYAYVNRIADGLGVEVEPWVTQPEVEAAG